MARRTRQSVQMLLVPTIDIDAHWQKYVQNRGWTKEKIADDDQFLADEIRTREEECERAQRTVERMRAQIAKLAELRELMNNRLVHGRQHLDVLVKQLQGNATPGVLTYAMNERYPDVRRGRGRPRTNLIPVPATAPPSPAETPISEETSFDAKLFRHLDQEGKTDRDLAKELGVRVAQVRAAVKRMTRAGSDGHVPYPQVRRLDGGLVAILDPGAAALREAGVTA